ncbi:hypothetical protein DL89DRAFT_308427 [Linderina pennispora]|uniref:Formamidopyrimidine-DNA glycosylase H2TH DNA-binding domain-containing protein n=1 Tax=Linderina pennispora TaxID=61395 RepID=A0A1Y1WGR5_9FUNG|nr:uncharacterized protein DL89DRAFT_308427 [Linderina pennispora]ORX72750.1 hypothetical protein DL89DRAFT_308427 [Linderina pennispora]
MSRGHASCSRRKCLGKEITAVAALDDTIVMPDVRGKKLESLLCGRSVTGTGRRGKQFWLTLTGPLVYVRGEHTSHYRMQGVSGGDAWPPRFTKLELEFGKDTVVAFADARRLAIQVTKLGFDPVIDPPKPVDFYAMVHCRRTPIKALLLNQDRIHPEQRANTLSEEQAHELLAQIISICTKAVAVNAESKLFPKDWLFHYRWSKGKKGEHKMPDGRAIEFVTVGGRTSAIIPRCADSALRRNHNTL